jgi:carboxypeptidase PM20D1
LKDFEKMKKKILLTIFGLLLVLTTIILFKTFTFNSRQTAVEGVTPLNIEPVSFNNLSQAIQIQTVSYDNPQQFKPAPFIALRNFLEKNYPLVKAKLSREIVNDYSLLYRWEGRNPALKPVVLLAHQDVVPVEAESLITWTEKPFSGLIKDGFIWGRGSLDDKIAVISIMESVERLLKEGFTPERTIYLAFGHDEEIGGHQGAEKISELLQSRKIKAEFVLDEGLSITEGVIPGLEKPAALIGIAEKGYASVELSVNIRGGHSSLPEKETAIGVLSKAIVRLTKKQFPARISPPVLSFFENIGPEMPFVNKVIFANLWLFKGLLISIFEKSAPGNATLRTTTAPTIFKSGIKDNLLPTEAKAVVNFRILPGETAGDVMAHIRKVVKDSRIQLSTVGATSEATPVSATDSAGYRQIEKTIRQVYPGIIVTPSMVLAGTDSKHYVNISPDIYRFLPIRLSSTDLSRIHGIDERIKTDNYRECVQFYYQLMRNSLKQNLQN